MMYDSCGRNAVGVVRQKVEKKQLSMKEARILPIAERVQFTQGSVRTAFVCEACSFSGI